MNECVAKIKAINPAGISDREAAELLRDLNRTVRLIRERNAGLSAQEAMEQATQQFVRNAEMVALAAKRNAYLGRMRRIQGVDTIDAKFTDYADGTKAILVGTQGGEQASRLSAGMEIDKLTGWYRGGFIADINRVEGGVDIVQKGLLGREVANALFAMNTKGASLDGMDVRAVAIAKVIARWQEIARTNANKAGAWIGKLDGYIISQSHDMVRIAADREGWMAMMREHADLPRMMQETGAESVDALLNNLYKGFSTGVHLKSNFGSDVPSKGLKGMAKGLSHDRVVHFKKADGWFTYNESFGDGSIYEGAFQGLNKMARATGLMRKLGPNHEATFDGIVNDLARKMEARGENPAKFLADTVTQKRLYMGQLDGSINIPGLDLFSTLNVVARGVNATASLGGSLLASVADTGVMAAGARFNNMNALDMIADSLKNFAPGQLRKSQDELDALADMGLAFETMATMLTSDRFGIDSDLRGKLGWLQQKFFIWNGQNRWTDAMRKGISMALSSNLARKAGSSFDGLGSELQRTLGLYGIDSGMWDIFRSGSVREVDGRRLMTPSAVAEIDDSVLAAYLAGKNQPTGKRAVEELREEITEKFRTYFTDQKNYMLLTPGDATQGIMKQGTAASSGIGQALRTVMQFKSFSVEFSQRVLGREYKQHGIAGVANMIFLTTLAGYAAMTLKDFAKGKSRREVSSPADAGKVFIAAMAQGGGLGIFGDILTSQVANRSQEAGLALFGPTVGDLVGNQGIAGILSRAASGEDPSAATVRFVQQNTPFANLFYLKLSLDYLIFWNAQEFVNPGSLARMEREMEQRTGQQMLVSPSRDRFQPE